MIICRETTEDSVIEEDRILFQKKTNKEGNKLNEVDKFYTLLILKLKGCFDSPIFKNCANY